MKRFEPGMKIHGVVVNEAKLVGYRFFGHFDMYMDDIEQWFVIYELDTEEGRKWLGVKWDGWIGENFLDECPDLSDENLYPSRSKDPLFIVGIYTKRTINYKNPTLKDIT